MNRVILIGRATKDFELRYTPNGVAVATCNIAVDRQTKDKETDFINVVAWKQTAEACVNHIKKGHRFGLEGRIQVRNYENNEGKRVYVTEVHIDRVEFLEPKTGGEEKTSNPKVSRTDDYGIPHEMNHDDLPF